MSADAWTIAFQILNFLLSFYILRRWLFIPVMRAMDERKARIEASLSAAERERAAAEKLRLDLEKEKTEFKRSAQAALEREEARLSDLAEDKARALNEAMVSKWARFDEQISAEKAEALNGASREAARAVVEIAGRATASLSGLTLEESVARKFCELFLTGRAEGIATLRKFYADERLCRIESSFAMKPKWKADAKAAIARALKTRGPHLEFGPAKDLLCGIRVVCGSLELVFGIDNYIEKLRDSL